MPFVIAAPEVMTAAANDLATIGSNVSAAHAAAANPTVGVMPAAADEVSAAIASVFADHAQAFQALAAKAGAFNDQFVQTLKSGGAAYAAAEATSAASLRPANAAAGVVDTVLFLEGLPVVGSFFGLLFPLVGVSLLLLLFGSLILLSQLGGFLAQFGL